MRFSFSDDQEELRQAVRDCALPDELDEILPAETSKRSDEERRNEALIFLLTLRHGVLKVEARLAWCEEALAALRTAAKENTHARQD